VRDRAERALRWLTDSVTRLADTADGRPHLHAVIGSECLGMNMAVVTVVAGPDGTLAPREVAFEGFVKQRAGRKAVELCRTRLLRDQAPSLRAAPAAPSSVRAVLDLDDKIRLHRSTGRTDWVRCIPRPTGARRLRR
jgi:hypothetical protein